MAGDSIATMLMFRGQAEEAMAFYTGLFEDSGIEFVQRLGVDLDRLPSATTLFEGTAREGVPHFPANVNIAAALSLAGIGFDRTRLKVVADPQLAHNTHTIEVRGKTGNIQVRLQNVPAPDNPKTAWLACYSALAALKSLQSNIRYGT